VLDSKVSAGRIGQSSRGGEEDRQLNLNEKIARLLSGQAPPKSGDDVLGDKAAEPWPNPVPPQMTPPTPELAVHKFHAERDRYEVETRVGARNNEARRRNELLDQLIVLALIVVAGIAVLKMDPSEWPRYVSPTLIGAVLFWVARRRGGPPDSD
jgi:hypothetical protein